MLTDFTNIWVTVPVIINRTFYEENMDSLKMKKNCTTLKNVVNPYKCFQSQGHVKIMTYHCSKFNAYYLLR